MNWRERALKKVAAAIYNQYPFIIVVAVLLTIISLGITGLFLKTKTGRIDLVSEKNPSSKRFLQFIENFGSPDELIILVQGGDPSLRQKAIQQLAEGLKKEKQLIESVYYRVLTEFIEQYGLQYLDAESLKKVGDSLRQTQDLLQSTEGELSLEILLKAFDKNIQKSFSERRALTAQEEEQAESFVNLLNQKELFKKEEAFDSFRSNGFLASRSQQIYFMFVKPTEKTNDFKFIKVFLESVQFHIDQVRPSYPELQFEITGVPPIICEEMTTTTKDVKRASLLSFLGITLLFMLGFQAFRKPLMVVTVMFMGIAYTFCFATVAVGSLNLMSIVFASMLLGSGNDFGVHIIMRYREERLRGHSCKKAIEAVVSQTGQGIISGAIATALVFYTLMFSNFKGFSEFGLISGTGVLICCVAMLIVIPAFLVLWEKSGKGAIYYDKKLTKARHQLTMPHVAKLLKYPKTVIAACLLLTAFFFYTGSSVQFNGSLLDIQARGSRSFTNEKIMRQDSSLSPRFAAVLANNLEEVKEKSLALKKLPAVSRVESIEDLLPEITEEKIEQLLFIEQSLQGLSLNIESSSVDLTELIALLERSQKRLQQVENYLQRKKIISEEGALLLKIKKEIEQTLAVWKEKDSVVLTQELQVYQDKLQQSVQAGVAQLKKIEIQKWVQMEQLPFEIKKRFVGKEGNYLIYVYPKSSVWSDAALTRFTEEVARVDAQATGTPFLVQEVTRLMEEGYKRSGWLALLVVSLLLFLDFRRLVPTLLALIPLVMGVVWMFGLMGLLGLEFNPANLIAVPLILGIAIDNGVHLVHRFYEKKAHRLDQIMRSTIKAVYLNSITTIVCFGSLILASHRGLASLGMLLVLGVLTCLITAITFLPALLTLFRDRVTR